MSDYREQAAIKLRGIFEKLSRELPDRLSGSEPLGLGGQGIVVDHLDGTVSKFFFKDSVLGDEGFVNEVDLLRVIGGGTFGHAKTPELVDVVMIDDSEIVYGAYRMTKLSGNEMNWHEFVKAESPKAIEKHFREAGALLAEFHARMQSALGERPVAPRKTFDWSNVIPAIPSLDHKTNQALSICKSRFEGLIEPGVNHGDFHCGNFRVDENFGITGLFDFSFTGTVPNRLMDFSIMPDDAISFATDEYQAINGRNSIDTDMVTMTQVSMSAEMINYWAGQPNGGGPPWHREQLYKCLNRLEHITGHSFK